MTQEEVAVSIPVIPIKHKGPGLVTQALCYSIDYGSIESLHQNEIPYPHTYLTK